jgi:hypothetical protein
LSNSNLITANWA